MSRMRPLIDEQTKQSVQCQQLGADLYPEHEDDEEPTWGSDPFSIIAHREELGLSNDD